MEAPPTPPASDAQAPASSARRPPRQAALSFIFITVVLDMIAMGVTAPVLPQLIQTLAGGGASQAGWINGVFVTVWALMQFLCSPIQGGLSDRFGRRPVLLISIAALGVNYALMAVAPTLGWLLAARLLTGATSANMSTASAYIADVTEEHKRAGAYGMLGAAFGLGFILGPTLGGILGAIDPRAPFWLSAALCLLNALYGYFVLPESLPKERRAPFNWRRSNSIGSIRLLAADPQLLRLSLINLVMQFAGTVYPTVFALYALNRYGWKPLNLGLSLAGFGLGSAIVQGALTGRATARFGERRVIIFGLACAACGFTMLGLSAHPWLFIAAIPILTLSGVSNPATMALMTRFVAPSEQGQLQGANMSLQSLAGIAAPMVFGGAYSLFVGPWKALDLPGAPFLLSALMMIPAAIMAWTGVRDAPPHTAPAPAP